MKTLIKKKTTISNQDNLILLCDSKSDLSEFKLTTQELNYIKKESKEIYIYCKGISKTFKSK